MSTPAFRIDQDPWIPVRDTTGNPHLIGLRDLFTNAHTYTVIGGTGWGPLAVSALYRILTAITYRVTGLDDPGPNRTGWEGRWGDAAAAGHFNPDQVIAYFDTYDDRWDLFDSAWPWMQDPRLVDLAEKETKQLNQLIARDPGDNAPVLRAESHAKAPSTGAPAEVLPHFLTALYFHAGSPTSVRKAGARQSNACGRGVARGGVSLHPIGGSVFHTLMAHLMYPVHPDLAPTGIPDLAPWERDRLHDPTQVFPPVAGIIGVLTARCKRSYLLYPDEGGTVFGVRRAPAHVVRAPKPKDKTKQRDADDFTRDPFLSYKPGEVAGWVAFRGDLNRQPWQDLDSYLALHPADDAAYRAPLLLTDMHAHWQPALGPLTIAVHIAHQDTAQDREKGSYTGAAPLTIMGNTAQYWPAVAQAVRHYNTAQESLDSAIRDVAKSVTAGSNTHSGAGLSRSQAASHYWNDAHGTFTSHLESYLNTPERAADDAADTALTVYDSLTRIYVRDLRHNYAVTTQRTRLEKNLAKGATTP